jgi:hypothetical protein
MAWKAIPGSMNVGSYLGDGSDDRNITGVGFEPGYVIIKAYVAKPKKIGGAHRCAAIGGADSTMNFNGFINFTDGIQALQADGFQIGSDEQVNEIGTTYYWMAFAAGGGGGVEP